MNSRMASSMSALDSSRNGRDLTFLHRKNRRCISSNGLFLRKMGSLQEKVACGRNVGGGRSWETAWDCEIGLGLFLPCERSFIWVVGASGVYECVSGYSPGCMERRCAMQTKTTRHVSKSWGSSGHGVTGHTVDFCVLASDLDKLKQRSA